VSWRGGALDRLVDEDHAFLVDAVVRRLRALGWAVVVEASFNHFGDRGSIDVLGFHAASQCAVVVEVKSDLTVVEETARRLDVKVRLASDIVLREFGARPSAIGRLLVLPRSTTAWRRIDRLRATFDAVLPGRTADARRWLLSPAGRFAGVMFVSSSTARGRGNRGARANRGRRA
jgi:hypothetical protein